ncbi:TetR/AcrR family transcriptional regulator [Alteromonas sp. a30]|uniref:TetR/AcrR family transcriptional regulator n=1 Tax=Alteromonas sp. a30 TaxID=2730917 RepID=UPI00227FD3C4|nr:TetR/AcrR family transcriptional regulator [Alteromonas sp. a30]MCY7295625.1 TetR/AcrR family transcriptional regulator [Alteromonas sp. a30]
MSETKKTRSEIKREAIISAARTAFQNDGVQNTSMDRIAEIAQVSKRTVYNHFSTKETLLFYIMKESWEKIFVQSSAYYNPNAPLKGQLIALLDDFIQLVSSENHINLSRAVFSYFVYHTEDFKKEVDKFYDRKTNLHHCLSAAVQDGRLIDLDIDKGIDQLCNLIKGACFWPQLMGIEPIFTEAQKTQLAEDAVDMFLSRYEA